LFPSEELFAPAAPADPTTNFAEKEKMTQAEAKRAMETLGWRV
jgi:hypothetical protein